MANKAERMLGFAKIGIDAEIAKMRLGLKELEDFKHSLRRRDNPTLKPERAKARTAKADKMPATQPPRKTKRKKLSKKHFEALQRGRRRYLRLRKATG